MIRAEALHGPGYDSSVIAAEDELSVRLRQTNGKLLRIDRDSRHDDTACRSGGNVLNAAAMPMPRFRMHADSPERKFIKKYGELGLVIVPLGTGADTFHPWAFVDCLRALSADGTAGDL